MVFRWPGTSWLDQAGWPASPQGSTVSHPLPSAGIISVRYPAQRFSPWVWGSNAVLRLAQRALWAVALVPMQYFSTSDKYLWSVFNCSLMCYAAAVYVSAWGEGSRRRSTLKSWLSPTTGDSGDWAQVFWTVYKHFYRPSHLPNPFNMFLLLPPLEFKFPSVG